MIAALRARFAPLFAGTVTGRSADPLLVAATVLLVVVLVGLVLAAVMTIVGALAHIAAVGIPWHSAPWEAAWVPLSGMALALVALWMMADIAAALLAMIAAVGRGEAFAAANVARIEAIAWRVLGLQILGLVGRTIGAPLDGDVNGLDIGLDLTPAGIAFVLMLFILARVFRQGAALQHDLEGTV